MLVTELFLELNLFYFWKLKNKRIQKTKAAGKIGIYVKQQQSHIHTYKQKELSIQSLWERDG